MLSSEQDMDTALLRLGEQDGGGRRKNVSQKAEDLQMPSFDNATVITSINSQKLQLPSRATRRWTLSTISHAWRRDLVGSTPVAVNSGRR